MPWSIWLYEAHEAKFVAGTWNNELFVDCGAKHLVQENNDEYEDDFKANSDDVALIVYAV